MVETLIKSIAKEGLRIPLIVRLRAGVAHLVAGLQRLEAVKALKWKEVACILVEDDENIARRVQIVENAHRAELTKLEAANARAELHELQESSDRISGKKFQKKGRGRPQGGDAEAARNLQVPGTSEDAKRKRIASDRKIHSLSPAVQQAATDAGFANDVGKLEEIADEKTEEQKFAKIEELQRRPNKASAPREGEPHLAMMLRKWKNQKKLDRGDWEKAVRNDQRAFIVEALKFPLKRKANRSK